MISDPWRLHSKTGRYATCIVEEMWKQQLPVGIIGDRSKKMEI